MDNKMENKMSFRLAEPEDAALILQFIRDLADYEKMVDQVEATEELLKEWIFEKKKAEVIFVLEDGKEAGFALFFHNFSTFLGRAGIYLEDLYVCPEYRKKGYGKALIRTCQNCEGERLRTAGVVVSGLESAQHRLLPLAGGRAYEGLDRVPDCGGHPGFAGGGEGSRLISGSASPPRRLLSAGKS